MSELRRKASSKPDTPTTNIIGMYDRASQHQELTARATKSTLYRGTATMDLDAESMEADLLLSLRPMHVPDKSYSSLADKISRINLQREGQGGFRTLTEESLRQEIAEEEAIAKEGLNSDDGSTDEEEDEEIDRAKELKLAREELLGQIESAHQSAMFALDFLSLTLSKDLPAQAATTVSPALRDLVGMGTLGLDKLNASRQTEAQKQENRQIARGWKAQSLNKTVDSIMASVARLEKETELETTYWEQVLDVSTNGWAVCRLPTERQTLGVRVGSLEASSAFKVRSLAALRRNLDGTVSLDQGMYDSDPQEIRIRIYTNGVQSGATTAPLLTLSDAPIEALILQARNTIFAEELWQEIQREARGLLAFGVSSSVTTVTCVLTPTKSAVIDLVPLSAEPPPPLSKSFDDFLAEGMHLAFHLSLSWAHRLIRRRRTDPPPPVSNSSLPEAYSLLRPLLTRLTHERTLNSLYAFLLPLTMVLQNASIDASYMATRIPFVTSPTLPKAEQIFLALTAHLESSAKLIVLPGTEITITTRTSMSRDMIPIFHVQLSADSAMNEICPPLGNFSSLKDVREWVFWCVGCALAEYFFNGSAGQEGWSVSAQPNVLKCETMYPRKASRLLCFTAKEIKNDSGREGVRLRLSWEKFSGSVAGHDEVSEALVSMSNGDAGSGFDVGKGGKDIAGRQDWVAFYGAHEERDDGKGRTRISLEHVIRAIGDIKAPGT